MAGAFDGRLIAAIHQGAPIKFVWEGAYVAYTYMTVLKGEPNTGNAQRLIAF
ncbi:mannopine transport system substrate-binding protein [Bradyrhizobium shewense]|uniref:Mannopine transport system substrate-binding protein n=1 Tax=Bradyrhizobium shewense TaxID=1761772 RepID=A0A1C3XTZ0_9BRAD|nr:mannopine transport system substrate-binding protein [Bradyrhizobium shewense]